MADGDSDEHEALLGIVAVADVAAHCYHHSLNYYLIDYYNIFVTVDSNTEKLRHSRLRRLRQRLHCDGHLSGRSEDEASLVRLAYRASDSDASEHRRRSQRRMIGTKLQRHHQQYLRFLASLAVDQLLGKVERYR